MGIADLIPGVSGGTIAFISGIYQNLLDAIKSLQMQSFKKIAWPFILPLGFGIAFSLISFSRPLYYLLVNYPSYVNAFFFGIIGASAYFCFRKANFKNWGHYIILSVSFVIAFLLSSSQFGFSLNPTCFSLLASGALASFALLLPGISGGYVLHLLGLYPAILFALAYPLEKNSLQVLVSLGIGVSLGLIFFSRLISWLLKLFYQITMAILIGLMVGGMRSLWPFYEKFSPIPLAFIALGFLATLFLERGVKAIRITK